MELGADCLHAGVLPHMKKSATRADGNVAKPDVTDVRPICQRSLDAIVRDGFAEAAAGPVFRDRLNQLDGIFRDRLNQLDGSRG
jgi:hypothetical protein